MARVKKDGRRATGIQSKRGLLYILIRKETWKDGQKVVGKQWITTGLTDTKENVKKAVAQRELLLARTVKPTIDRNISVKDYVEIFLNKKAREVKDTTYASYIYRCARISEYFGDKKLRDIRVSDVERFLDLLFTEQKISPRSVRDTKSLFATMAEQAIRDEVLIYNPVKEAVISKKLAAQYAEEKESGDDFFSYEEAVRFLEIAYNHELYELFYCTIFFGMRREEALGIRWSCIDLEHKTLKINHTVTKGTGVNRLNSTKTDASIRKYPLTDAQVEMFRALKRKENRNRKLFGDGYIENDYVFKHQDGSLYYPDYPTKAFGKLIRQNPELPQKITFHGLRASCVSILVHEGFDIKSIQKWVGHADANTTISIYTKVKEKEAKLEISEGMDSLIQPSKLIRN